MSRKQHSYIPVLQQQLAEGRIDRREFLRTATLLGVSAGAAYGFVGKLFGEAAIAPARADALPKGGTIRIAQRVKDITSPHAINWLEAANIFRQVAEYLTKTGTDNITRPYLLEGWEASDDLKTWTLHIGVLDPPARSLAIDPQGRESGHFHWASRISGSLRASASI
jgi:peptide/nickel transport system substrate-binding protein